MKKEDTVMKKGPNFILLAKRMGWASASRVLVFPCDYVNGGDEGGDVDSNRTKEDRGLAV